MYGRSHLLVLYVYSLYVTLESSCAFHLHISDLLVLETVYSRHKPAFPFSSLISNRMAADDPLCPEPLVSVEFQVFGKVQGVYFPKYVRDICLQLEICGWVKNSKTGTILGKMQGSRALVDQMAQWLTSMGSPGSEIHHCEFTNWETITKRQYQGFVIRF